MSFTLGSEILDLLMDLPYAQSVAVVCLNLDRQTQENEPGNRAWSDLEWQVHLEK